MKNFARLVSLTALVFLIQCTKTTSPKAATRSPEDVVKAFVQQSAAIKDASEKKGLVDSCTGEMKQAFSGMTEEQFRIFYLNGNIKIEDLKILATHQEGETATVRYQVKVENKQGTDITNELNEREAALRFVDGEWLIESVRPRGIDKLAFTRGMIF